MNLRAVHLFLVAAWIGVVLVESLMEGLAFRRAPLRPAAVTFHYFIDLFIELPLVFAILGTGAVLLEERPMDGRLMVKVVSGLVALFSNLVAGVIVHLRHRGDPELIDARSRLLFIIGGIGVPTGFIALYIGLSYVL
jgi:hypothetical protein